MPGIKGIDSIDYKSGRTSDENTIIEVEATLQNGKTLVDRFERIDDDVGKYVETVDRGYHKSASSIHGVEQYPLEATCRQVCRYVGRIVDDDGNVIAEFTYQDND